MRTVSKLVSRPVVLSAHNDISSGHIALVGVGAGVDDRFAAASRNVVVNRLIERDKRARSRS